MNLESKLEALLFFKGEPVTKKKMATILACDREELESALSALERNLENRGLCVISNGDEIEMRTSPDAGSFIEKLTKDELVRDLGKAGLETLTIILYKHPVKRSEIDYIRGVNSSFILRNLLIRGLIERMTESSAAAGANSATGWGRGYSYRPTIDLLSHLGISKIEDLPEYATVKAEMENFAGQEETETTEKTRIAEKTEQ
ncbi:MAG: SMC-Scp complex subunit ScpB [Patescibacteria group bacterium]